MSRRTTGVALAVISAIISGVSVYVNGLGVKHFHDASVYTTAKNGLAGLLLLAALAALPPKRAPRARRAIPARPLILVAVIGGSVPFILFFEGLARAQSTQAALIQKTLVIWVAILAVPILGERFRRPHALAIALLLAGQAWLAGSAGHVAFGSGEAMILAATLMWAVEVVYVKRLMEKLDARVLATARMALGTLLLVVWLLITGRAAQLLALSGTQWRWVLITGVLLSGYVGTWYAALARAPAVDVTAVLVLGAVITALLAGTAGPAPINAPALLVVAAGCGIAVAESLRRAPVETVSSA